MQGVGALQGGALQFSAPSVLRCDESDGYQETLKLVGYVGDPLKALQLKVIIPNALLTNVSGVSRGSNLPSAQWNFSYQIYHNPTNEEVRIVLFGNGTNSLPPGTYNDLIRFSYSTVNVTGAVPQVALISLTDVLGSTPSGTNAGVTADPDQNVNVVNSTYLGDVNDDDMWDILDLLMIVDHILGRITLTPDQFLRADIAPWSTGDGSVNVLDLALLQQIILDGHYPPGPLPWCGSGPSERPIVMHGRDGLSKVTTNADAKLTFYMTTLGIVVRMENVIPVKGLQLEFGSVPSVPVNMGITTVLGEAFYNHVNQMLRVLMYDQGGSMLAPGDRLVSNIPFSLANPGTVTLDHYVVAGAENNRIENVEIVFSDGPAPELPVDYMLSQNYPNPFNPTTSISFSVPEASIVRIAIYDLLGQEVRTLFDGPMERGTNEVRWDGRNFNGTQASSGLYIYRMIAGSFVESRKMMFLK
jgi:hypothetical protein